MPGNRIIPTTPYSDPSAEMPDDRFSPEPLQPPLHLAENARRGMLIEQLAGILREMMLARSPEADTEELKIIAKSSQTPPPRPSPVDRDKLGPVLEVMRRDKRQGRPIRHP